MYGDVRAATLALSASDDAVAAPGAPKRLLGAVSERSCDLPPHHSGQ
jgi:hypothetical protein